MNQKYEEFYQPIPEDKQMQLQQRLSQKLPSHMNEAVNHDFMHTHIDYVDRYQKFLRNQKYSDGLLRQLLKEFNNARNLRKVINHVPGLDEPKLFEEKS